LRSLVALVLFVVAASIPIGGLTIAGSAYTTVTAPISTYVTTASYTTYYGSSIYAGTLQPIFQTSGQGIPQEYDCSLVWGNLSVSKGAMVSFSITSNNPVIFYVMTPEQFKTLHLSTWTSGIWTGFQYTVTKYLGYFAMCGSAPPQPTLQPPSFIDWPALETHSFDKSYDLNWTAPNEGQYLWVLSTGQSRNEAKYSLNVWSIVSQSETYTMMQTGTSQEASVQLTSQLNSAPTHASANTFIVIVVIGVVILSGLVLYIIRRNRAKKDKTRVF